jgi:primosomal protein N' (replication factor Y)
MSIIVKVCIPHTFYDGFDYLTDDQSLLPGMRVWVPFRNSTRVGIVVEEVRKVGEYFNKLKSILSIIDEQPILDQEIITLCLWVSKYYQSPLSEVLPLALPKKLRKGELAKLPSVFYIELNKSLQDAHDSIPKKAFKQHALIDFLSAGSRKDLVAHFEPLDPAVKPRDDDDDNYAVPLHDNYAIPLKDILQQGFSKSQIQALVDLNILKKTSAISLPLKDDQGKDSPLKLNEEQAAALQSIKERKDQFHCFLLQGITGSGKTEVYLQLIESVLLAQQQVLILVPEIGLTPQLLERFRARFKQAVSTIHSGLNDTERQAAWQMAKENRIQILIGTRTAVFTPMPKLGLIIIDEEHDSSLKQMEGVRYSARDTALIRAHQANIPIILGSATPSLETIYNCIQNKYTRLRLNQKALNSAKLHYQLVDLRNQPMHEGLSPVTLTVIKQHLQKNNQVLVFINRRGYAPVFLCHHCGWMADCPACDGHLTVHKQLNCLICHHCGLTQKLFTQCAHCKSKELIPIGTGTQRVQSFLQSTFPETTILRIDRDEIRKKNELDRCLTQIGQGEAQLIVGTQMLAKGHHFPKLTLVVVVDADAGFYNQDFRALEQLGQLLTQVAGRAGRAMDPGQVIIQTHLPQHPLLNLLIQQGYEPFVEAVLNQRQEAKLPPYQYLALVRAQDKNAAKVKLCLQNMKNYLAESAVNLQLFGPAPAPLAKKANQHRMQLLIKSPSRKHLQAALTQLRSYLILNKQSVRWNIDVDPLDLS